MKSIAYYLKNPYQIFEVLRSHNMTNWISDELYLKILYKEYIGKDLNLKNPLTFNEKLQWLKLNDRNPLYTVLVDKHAVKQYVEEKIGKEYVIPTIAVWERVEDINISNLPDRFVLKCTHDSGGVVICRDKGKFDLSSAQDKLKRNLKKNYYYSTREWPYKHVKPRIIAEPYLESENGNTLNDYKLLIFNGKHKCSFVCSGRNSDAGLHVTFYDPEWNVMPFERHYPRSSQKQERPCSYKKMIQLAEILSKGIPFVRVDFYEVGGNPYFGEMTFFPGGGFEEFSPEIWDRKLGDMLDITAVGERKQV